MLSHTKPTDDIKLGMPSPPYTVNEQHETRYPEAPYKVN